jgi:hypothetical protein
MSVATFKGEGDAALSAYIYKNQSSKRIYLRRNVRKVAGLLTMGKALSSLRSSRPRDEPLPSEDEDDEDPRPAKRRRVNYGDDRGLTSQTTDDPGFRKPLGQVTNEGSRGPARLPGKPGLLQPADFYGKPRLATPIPPTSKLPGANSKSSKGQISSILRKPPNQFRQSLRVDIVEISPASAVDVESFAILHPSKSPIDIKCRCSVSVFYAKNDENPGDVQPRDYVELCRTNKYCTLRITFGEDDEISREFLMSEPFLFTPDQFHVNRKLRKPNGQWAPTTVDFADKYNLQVLIEPVGFHEDWPPIDIPTVEELLSVDDEPPMVISEALDDGQLTKDDLQLACKTEARLDALLDPDRQNRLLDLQLCHRTTKQALPYTLKLEIKWALPSPFCNLPVRTSKAESSRATLPPPPTVNIMESPVRRLREDISASNSPADSRAHRRRSNVPTYNLKALSAQAQGKSPRVRKTRDIRSEHRGLDGEEITVTYNFGKADAADTGVKQQTVVPGLDCPFCNTHYGQVDELRLHLHTDHSMFKFHLRKSSPPRISFFVELIKSRTGPMLNIERAKTHQFGKPMSLFDLEKNLSGDESWARGRQGPLHNTWPDHLTDRAHDSSLSSSPHESRHSSPNTSNDTDDLMEFDAPEIKIPVKPRKVYYVPKTAKPLYDTITKRILQPGEELPNSDDEKEEGWLHQKSRDLINDFTDVTLEEKDFINTYNPFIINEQLTSPKYLPEALVRFAEVHKTWFTERQSRKREFMKLMEVFIIRGVVEQKCLDKCVDILRAAERSMKGKDVDMNEATPRRARGLGDCICGEHTKPPNRVVCRGPVSFFFSPNIVRAAIR